LKVTINGKRVEDLERKELHYYEVIKSSIYIIAGALAIVCLPGLLDIIAGLNIGADRVVDAFKMLQP